MKVVLLIVKHGGDSIICQVIECKTISQWRMISCLCVDGNKKNVAYQTNHYNRRQIEFQSQIKSLELTVLSRLSHGKSDLIDDFHDKFNTVYFESIFKCI